MTDQELTKNEVLTIKRIRELDKEHKSCDTCEYHAYKNGGEHVCRVTSNMITNVFYQSCKRFKRK